MKGKRIMMLTMYIHNMLIDKTEIDFSFCDTIKKREERVQEMRHYLYNNNFNKPFIARQEPVFYLSVSSKANDIIMQDIDNKLITELEDELLLLRGKNILVRQEKSLNNLKKFNKTFGK